MFCFDKKRHMVGKKYNGFQEHLKKTDVSEIAKFIIVNFYEKDFMKCIFILVKGHEMCNILKPSTH